MTRIACSGFARPNTGIGVVQKHLYPRLEEAFGVLELSPARDLGRSMSARILGLVNGFRSPATAYSVFLSVVPPLPFFLKGRVVTILHDLRWMRTRRGISRYYRRWDLRRTVRLSDSIVCISQRTWNDLIELFPEARDKAVVSWLGPGLVPHNSFTEKPSGNLLLIGGAPHKANEDAARLLANVRPKWLQSITGIGVSNEVRVIVEKAFGAGFATWLNNISDEEVVDAYKEAEYFMLLGTDEGFGLPFVEALASGCQVIATDQPLTRELLGDACTYLSGNALADQIILQHKPGVPVEVRRSAVSKFDWSQFAGGVMDELVPIHSCDLR